MLNVYEGFSSHEDTKIAAKEIIRQIKKPGVSYVIFFAANTYDFELLSSIMKEAFTHAEVVGCTTAGEISHNHLTQNSISAMAISSNNFITSTTVVEDISTIPMMFRDDLIKTFRKTGLSLEDPSSAKKGFALTLIDGLSSAEEKTLSVINSIFKYSGFPIIGGSAGDGLDFIKTKVSYNGNTFTNAAVVTFVNPNCKFYILKENIFKPAGNHMVVTRADIRGRIIYELDNMPAARAYAEKLGIGKKDLPKYFTTNPLGRKIGDDVWIASPFKINSDDSIQFYCQVLTNSILEILKPLDPVEVINETSRELMKNVPNLKGIIAINCILRRLQFEEQKIGEQVMAPLSNLAPLVGFSSYGEQLNGKHLNQTLVLLGLGE
ncbi:MAG: hypothetical protein GX308_09035 [Epulopiscium sp.]|nr:hypothetical protein [Candidatus Epulonipiscium sp.]